MKRFLTMRALCMASLVYRCVRGRARPITGVPARIGVFQMAKLGDMVCTTPVFRALRTAYKDAHITVIGNSINESVLEGNTDITTYVVFEGILKTRARLAAQRLDVAIVTGPDSVSLAVAFLSGARSIVVPKVVGGYSPFETFSYRMLRRITGAIVVEHTMGTYAPGEYLRLLTPLGITATDTTKHLFYSPQAKQVADTFIATHTRPIVGLLPSAGNRIKEWPAERFAAVADTLVNEYKATVVVLGGVRDVAAATAVCEKVETHVLNTCGQFSVDELKAVIANLDLVVGVDTGPVYIAEAFGVATVDIVGPMDENEQPPRGGRHIVVVPPGRVAPALHIMYAKPRDIREARRQVESISVAQIMDAVAKLLPKRTVA